MPAQLLVELARRAIFDGRIGGLSWNHLITTAHFVNKPSKHHILLASSINPNVVIGTMLQKPLVHLSYFHLVFCPSILHLIAKEEQLRRIASVEGAAAVSRNFAAVHAFKAHVGIKIKNESLVVWKSSAQCDSGYSLNLLRGHVWKAELAEKRLRASLIGHSAREKSVRHYGMALRKSWKNDFSYELGSTRHEQEELGLQPHLIEFSIQNDLTYRFSNPSSTWLANTQHVTSGRLPQKPLKTPRLGRFTAAVWTFHHKERAAKAISQLYEQLWRKCLEYRISL
jgi:hypothetical protein